MRILIFTEMRSLRHYIPNTVTSLNLMTGFVAIIFTAQGQLSWAFVAMLVAAGFDFFDGLLARLLQVSSEYGKILDSLADVVSFGVLPAYMLYAVILQSSSLFFPEYVSQLAYAAVLPAVFSALRLAKFHLDTRQTDQFIGLPTPANALFIGSFVYLFDQARIPFVLHTEYILLWVLLSSYLLVSELPLIALKLKSFKFTENLAPYTVIAGSVLLFLWGGMNAIPLIIIFYIFVSILFTIRSSVMKK